MSMFLHCMLILKLYPVFYFKIFGLVTAVAGFTEQEVALNYLVIQYFLLVNTPYPVQGVVQ